MNPPTDPFQLLVYGIATIIVVLALKLWDRRRDRALRTTVDEAAGRVTTAAEEVKTHAEAVASAQAGTTRATGDQAAQAAQVVKVGEDVSRSLIYLAEQIGELRGDMRSLERAVDLQLATEKVRRSHARVDS